MQILVGTPATISATWYVDGDVGDPGAVTVTVTKADGTALYSDEPASGSGAAARTLALTPADTAALDRLTAVWDSVTLGELVQQYEIVGDLLFIEAEARAIPNEALASLPDAELLKARALITDAFEQRCGVAFVPRYKRVTLSGDGTDTLFLPDLRVLAIRTAEYRTAGEMDWTAFESADLDDMVVDAAGLLVRERRGIWPQGRQNVRVAYEYGYERCPLEINRAALLLLRDLVVPSNIDARATSFSDELGTYRLVTPGLTRNAMYSNPEVNAILMEFNENVPVVG